MFTVNRFMTAAFAAGVMTAALTEASAAGPAVCVAIDEAHDTLSPRERSAALLMLSKQFEINGNRVADGDCEMRYTLSHIQLGERISVTLSGPGGSREGTALGLEDLAALYSQMVRSIVTGRPMSGFNVIDRTNVTAAQDAPAHRIHPDSFGYARLGYGGVFGDRTYGGPSLGFGYRAELDAFALDVSFLNFQMPSSSSSYGPSSGGGTGSILKLQGLHFVNAMANSTAYFGGGMSYGFTSFGGSSYNTASSQSSWSGGGLQGEVTVGYEMPRASSMRVFVEANATVPLYNVESTRITYSSSRSTPYVITSSVSSHRYAPSLAVSVGLGWQRHRLP